MHWVFGMIWLLFRYGLGMILHGFEVGYRNHPRFRLACLSLNRFRRAFVPRCSDLALGSLDPDSGGTKSVMPFVWVCLSLDRLRRALVLGDLI